MENNIFQLPPLQSETTELLEASFCKAQSEFSTIGKDSTARFKYASLPNILKSVIPALTKYGLNIKQKGIPHNNPEFPLIIITQLSHESGQYSQSLWPVPMPAKDELRGSTTIQGLMSNKSYIERHALKALLCLAIDDEDTDGEYAATKEPYKDTITDKQLALLQSKINGSQKAIDYIKQKYAISSMEEILKKDFGEILDLFKSK
jgi:hypothetical protein